MSESPQIFAASDAYEQFMGRWSRRLAPLLVKFAGIAERDSVLDVGSGTGALAFSVLEVSAFVRVTGVDPSSAFVREARARAPRERMRFLVGNAQALEIPNHTFDKTLSLLAMNFMPQPAKAIAEMIRVTRAGGIVAAAVWDYGDGMEMLRAFWDEAAALDPAVTTQDERHMPLCKPGELAELWRMNGLEHVVEEPLTIELAFASFDDYWAPFFGGQGPAGTYAASLPEPARAALASRLRTRLLGEKPDGPFTIQARAWAVKGVVVVD